MTFFKTVGALIAALVCIGLLVVVGGALLYISFFLVLIGGVATICISPFFILYLIYQKL